MSFRFVDLLNNLRKESQGCGLIIDYQKTSHSSSFKTEQFGYLLPTYSELQDHNKTLYSKRKKSNSDKKPHISSQTKNILIERWARSTDTENRFFLILQTINYCRSQLFLKVFVPEGRKLNEFPTHNPSHRRPLKVIFPTPGLDRTIQIDISDQ